MELSWTGKSKELSSGNSWAVTCEEGELGDKMVIEVDVTKFRVQPFRSYKVCINLEDSPTNSHLDEVCSHLFSFEKYVPYMPEEEEKNSEDKYNSVKVIEFRNDKNSENESVLDLEIEKEKNEREIKTNSLIKSDIIKSEEKQFNKGSIESVLKHQLKDIENFVRDDYKADFLNVEKKIIEEIDLTTKYSSSERLRFSFLLLLCFIFISMFIH